MNLEELAPAPSSKKLAEITLKTFGFGVDLEHMDLQQVSRLRETYVNRLSKLDNTLGANASKDKSYYEAKLVVETIDRFIDEISEDVDLSDEANELVLFGENDYDLYRQRTMPIQKNLTKKFAKGVYDPELAQKLWMYWATDAAKRYANEHSTGDDWNRIFSVPVRKEVAAYMEEYWREELEAGNAMEGVEEAAVIEKNEGINEGETEDAFDMIHQGIKDILQQMAGRGSKFHVSMASDHPKLSKHIQDTLVDLLQTMNSSLQNGKIVAESVVMEEGEMQDSETVMAAVHITDRIQGMLEDLGEIMNEDLPPLVDSIRNTMDATLADSYNDAVKTAVDTALEAVRTAREAVDGAARALTGEAPAMGAAPAEPVAEPPAADAGAEPPAADAGAEPPAEGLGGADEAAGGEEVLGREERA